MSGEWWSSPEKGGTPLNNLLMHLGLDVQVTAPEGASLLVWEDSPSNQDVIDSLGGLVVNPDGFQAALEGVAAPLLTAGGQTVGFEAAVGEGHVIACSLSSATYSASNSGAELLRQLTRHALQYTDYSYVPSDAFTVRRGNYVAVHPVRGGYTLERGRISTFF